MTTDAEVVIVAAVASNGVIGHDGELPWHHPEDLAHFKDLTMGHPVIVGRHTYESIVDRLGEPLPGRVSVVLSRSIESLPDGAVVARSVEDALAAAQDAGTQDDIDAGVVYVIGGATVYEQLLPVADRMVRTELEAAHEGDTRFPDWDRAAWQEVARDARAEFDFVEYERVQDR